MNWQHYPTTFALSQKAWAKFKNHNFKRIYEPSVGAGDLLQAGLNKRSRIIIDVCEIDPQFHPLIPKIKGSRSNVEINIVGYDCMQMQSGSIYSHVVMNPPFAYGAQHVLKAWDLVWDAEIVAILNAETIRNPFCADRRRLVDLITQFGEVEFIEEAFATPDAQIKTNVEIALVYLRKQANIGNDIFGQWIDDLKCEQNRSSQLAKEFKEELLPALPNSQIENMVITFNMAVQTMKESIFMTAKSNHYKELVGKSMGELVSKELATKQKELSEQEDMSITKWVRDAIEEGYLNLKDRAWASILRSTNVTERLSSKAQKRLESEFKTICKLEFTVANIYGFLTGLIENQGQIQMDMACDVFDAFITYHSDNTVFFKGHQNRPNMGWKSNDKHRSCGMRLRTTRMVHPGHRVDFGSTISWDSQMFLADIDRVFAMLDGKQSPEHSLVSLFNTNYQALKGGERLSTSYFDVRFYPGRGTIHFFPTNKVLVDRLNRMVGKHREWLPPNENDVSANFWEQYEKAEKLDRDLRAELKKTKGQAGMHRDPLASLARQGLYSEDKASLEEVVVKAMNVVFEKHGISTEFQLGSNAEERGVIDVQNRPLLAA